MRSFWNVQTEVFQIHESGTKSLEIVCFMSFLPLAGIVLRGLSFQLFPKVNKTLKTE